MGHVTGPSRAQATLFPEALDEVVAEEHPVRVIDAFVDGLALGALGFSKVVAEATGRPPYAPGDLLKLYLYGYLNQVRSSRRLARETQRNVEVMWLVNQVTPSFRTIADFRKDHAPAIAGACRAFIRFCRQQELFGAELVAIDGTKIAAVASRKQVMTPKRIEKMTAAIDRKITEYLWSMDESDRAEGGAEEPGNVTAAVAALHEQRAWLQQQAAELVREHAKQKVLSEPEARLMRGPHGHQVAYNAQIAVDARHHLIAAFDLSNEGNDQQQLYPMAAAAKQALEAETLTVVADTGYSNGEHGSRCEQANIIAAVPRPETVNPKGAQYFRREAFSYDRDCDSWRCPAGETLSCRKVSRTQQNKEYWTDACGRCPLKPQCTGAAKRVIVRSFHEDAREAMHRRVVADPALMKLRRETAEHPFGTIKWLMGTPRFLLRGLNQAKSELALGVLSYNLKRATEVLGVPRLLVALKSAPC